MRRTGGRLLATLIVVAAATAPAGAQSREQRQMMADIRMLQEQTQQLQVAIASLTEALRAVATRIDEQSAATRRGFADHKLLVDTMAGDLRVVREKIDETNVRLTALSQDVDGIREIIPQMPPPGMYPPGTADGTVPDPVAGNPDAPATLPAPPPPVPVGTGTTPRRLYEMAYADYTAGQWSLAIQGFDTYLKTYPRSELADDAQYYIGESHAADNQFAEAVAAYQRVIRDYPNSDVLPEAYYKIGLNYERLGQPDRAREAFEFAVKTYGDTDAGRLAKQRLDGLNRRSR